MKLIILLFISFFSFTHAEVTPSGRLSVGNGIYTWFMIDVYKVRFKADNVTSFYSGSLSLELSYFLDLKGKDIAKRSIKEIKRSHELVNEDMWSKKLQNIFPNVKAGDSILANYDPKRGIVFYKNRKNELGRITDLRFSKIFLDIWLGRNTTDKKLRKKLLGLNNE